MNKENDVRYLYRGINLESYEEAKGRLAPKGAVSQFMYKLSEVEALINWPALGCF
jgi:hypothetical protein